MALWSIGLVAYAVFYAWHVTQVLPRIPSEAHAHADGWLRLGGAGFLIATAQMNAYLLLLPQWVTGIYLAAALLGAATWNTPGGRLIGFTIAAYTAAFALVGNDFNQYWGCLTAPLLCLAAARAPFVLRDCWRLAVQSTVLRNYAWRLSSGPFRRSLNLPRCVRSPPSSRIASSLTAGSAISTSSSASRSSCS